jgi:hypothetical protein
MAQKPPQENPSRGAVRRLIAAGASPQRANQFAQQAMAKAVPAPAPKNTTIRGDAPRTMQPVMPEMAPMVTPEMAPAMMPEVAPAVMPEVAPAVMPEVASEGMVSAMSAPQIGKPQGYNEWYNDKLGVLSFKVVPYQYRPPKVTDPSFPQYYDLVLGKGSAFNAFKSVILQKPDAAKEVPRLNGILASFDSPNADKFEKTVLQYIASGVPQATVLQYIANTSIPSKLHKDKKAQQNAVNAMYTEYNQKIASPFQAVLKSTANEDMDFKYGIPSDKLKWGVTTDLKNGTVAYTQSEVYKQLQNAYPKASKAKLDTAFAQWVTQKSWSPWREETQRRDQLKGKTLP